MSIGLLEQTELSVINVGVEMFVRSVRESGGKALQLDWQPPGDGDAQGAWVLAGLASDVDDATCAGARIDRANALVVERVLAAQPVLVDVALHARDVWPGFARTLLHAGAPIKWPRMCGPMQGAMIGAVLYEGWADDAQAAEAMLAAGEISFLQCHDFGAVGPMAGVISPSMPLFVVRNQDRDNVAYSNMSEGIGRVLRFGANGPDVIERLRWIEAVLAPTLRTAVRAVGGINLKMIQAQALLMGDEVHSRNAAATLHFLAAIAGPLAEAATDRRALRETFDFIAGNSQFFLNLSMASSKAIMDAGHDVAGSSIVTAIARNGVTTAIRVSGLGAAWFQSPCDTPLGLYFPGFSEADSNPDLGDSAICETAGFGGFSLAASPALLQLIGGSVAESIAYSREMYEITAARNPSLSLPNLDFSGAPCAIDIRKVVDTGIRPVITTGIAHKQAGIGQIGAGIVRTPMGCFVQAVRELAGKLESDTAC
ncbi:MAG: DUF1116 domain-containing protein [Caldimonas sp.]